MLDTRKVRLAVLAINAAAEISGTARNTTDSTVMSMLMISARVANAFLSER